MDMGKINNFNMNKDMLNNQKYPNNIKLKSEGSISKKNIINDMVSISNEAKELIAENENALYNNEKIGEIEQMLKDLKEASNKTGNPLDLFTKCIQIALRIMKGDNVPIKDMHFLAENEPELYSNALLLRQKKDKPKDHDSLLEDEVANKIKLENELEDILSDISIDSIEDKD